MGERGYLWNVIGSCPRKEGEGEQADRRCREALARRFWPPHLWLRYRCLAVGRGMVKYAPAKGKGGRLKIGMWMRCWEE